MFPRLAAESLWGCSTKLKKDFGLWLFIFISCRKAFLSDVVLKIYHWQVNYLSVNEKVFDWQVKCLSVACKICHWQAFYLSVMPKRHWQAIYLSVKEIPWLTGKIPVSDSKIFHWQAKHLSVAYKLCLKCCTDRQNTCQESNYRVGRFFADR